MTSITEMEQLHTLLDKAEKLAAEYTGGYSNNFLSAEEFHATLKDSICKLKGGDLDQLNDLWLWFAPTCDWDDFIRSDGADLANKIFSLATELRRALMVYSIYDLITDYQENIQRVITAFEKEFKRTDLLTACRSDKIFPERGQLAKYHIRHYSFHGIGLAVEFDDNTSVDFDFAFLPKQRHDGFDLLRLGKFVSSRPGKYKKYLDRGKLEKDFNALAERGAIVNPQIDPPTTLYFFRSSLANPDW